MRRLRMSLGLLFVVTLSGLFSPPVFGNNIRVDGKPRVINIISDTAIIEVNLRWDNSWRDDFNWDAAWVFFKFKKRGLENTWQHAYLSYSGHILNPSAGNEGGDYAYMIGASNGKVNGLYVIRNGISEGNVRVRLQAKWPLAGTGLSKSDFGDDLNKIYIGVHGIEMVYVPYGAYYLGDAHSYKSFAIGDTAAVIIDSEEAFTLSAKDGMSNVWLAASYPKGYAGFYIMKYETSQEQYVEFLNSLTLDQQKSRVTNNDFANMQRGNYVFGNLKTPSCRNGIVFIEQRKPNTPVVFGNNLNPANDLFSADDGQTLACNYMSVEDMLAYCSWSGLRPMSELEYEKACRRFYPQVPDKGEYAWNMNSGVNSISSLGELNYRGDEREQALSYSKNVNSGGHIDGPVRCGMFATAATNQMQAGATYWAVMEMSGNLKELCVNVNYNNLNGGSCGAGVYNPNLWYTSTSYYGVRGGGFNSTDDLLRTSDRTEVMNYFTATTQRDSTVGFRSVYSLSGIEIDGGEISAPDTGCWGGTDIDNIQEAFCPDFPNVRFQYNWYVKKPGEAKFELLEHATDASLKNAPLTNTTTYTQTYQFKRVGISSLGIAESNTLTIKILPKPFPQPEYNFDAGSSVEVTQYWGTTPSATWQLEGAPTWAYIHGTASSSLTIAGGLINEEFTLKARLAQCPAEEFSATIKISNIVPYRGHMDSITLPAGTYKMECWGAQGGTGYVDYRNINGPVTRGGYGGYAQGTTTLNAVTTYYVYVGGRGGSSEKTYGGSGGWNGGATGGGDSDDDCGGGGGGGTDIRIGGQSWSDRIIVAGGGGGGAGGYGIGGSGGGDSGGYGRNYSTSAATSPGTQNSGWAIGYGDTGYYGGSGKVGGGGGGGGYYGGRGGLSGNAKNAAGGGGGSGYVNTDIFKDSSMSNSVQVGSGKVEITPLN